MSRLLNGPCAACGHTGNDHAEGFVGATSGNVAYCHVDDHSCYAASPQGQAAVPTFGAGLTPPLTPTEVRAAALREAADEVHTEARWQMEQARVQQSWRNPDYSALTVDRLLMVEQILRDRAKAMSDQ